VTVYPKPTLGFSANSLVQCFSNHSFTFTNSSTIASGTLSYSWNFGDGSSAVSTASPTKTYSSSGSFKVLLTATSALGCVDTTSKFVKLHPKASLGFSVNNLKQCLKSGATSNSFTFTNSSTFSVGTLTYTWDFGDGLGNTSASTSPTYVYSNAGSFKVVLKSTTPNGCIDTVSKWVVVHPKTTPNFTVNAAKQCLTVNSFTFTNTSSIPSGSYSSSWDLGDGSVAQTTANANRTYSAAGTYKVILTTTSSNNCVDTVSANVVVYPKSTPGFSVNNLKQCLKNNGVNHSFVFTNTSTIASGSISYSWNFGDGSAAVTTTSPSKQYTSAGTYKVVLTVTSNFSCVDTISKWIVVYPQANITFSLNTRNQCLKGNAFAFTNGSSISLGTLSHVWDYGDGSATTTVANGSRTYTTEGVYQVKLKTTSSNGCVDTLSTWVKVYPKPNPSFTVTNTNACLKNNSFTFNNGSTISSGTLTHNWDFGDATTSTSLSPSKSYASVNSYKVTLTTTSNFSCTDTVSKYVKVFSQPTPGISLANRKQCLNNN
jgi:PKD repeat protein